MTKKKKPARRKAIDSAVNDAVKGKQKNAADIKAFLSKKRTPEQQRDLRIQLSAAGISATKNSARDKVRLRKIRKKKK